MKRVLILVLMAFIWGCGDHEAAKQKPAFSDEDFEEVRVAHPGMTERCLNELRYRGMAAWRPDDPACYAMTPPQRWSGLWNSGWEWTDFCPDPAKECPIASERGDIWLEFANGAYPKPEPADGLYRIEFIGRRTARPGYFGHMSQYDHLIVVDRLISIRAVQVPWPAPDTTKKQ